MPTKLHITDGLRTNSRWMLVAHYRVIPDLTQCSQEICDAPANEGSQSVSDCVQHACVNPSASRAVQQVVSWCSVLASLPSQNNIDTDGNPTILPTTHPTTTTTSTERVPPQTSASITNSGAPSSSQSPTVPATGPVSSTQSSGTRDSTGLSYSTAMVTVSPNSSPLASNTESNFSTMQEPASSEPTGTLGLAPPLLHLPAPPRAHNHSTLIALVVVGVISIPAGLALLYWYIKRHKHGRLILRDKPLLRSNSTGSASASRASTGDGASESDMTMPESSSLGWYPSRMVRHTPRAGSTSPACEDNTPELADCKNTVESHVEFGSRIFGEMGIAV
ncbi:hypothetical protein GY45DRAFT_207178 [Cubamyces sp. BRFM 1775]|nr:hypothetical protein GY45DRAFT_207178 [Cubamyces sp. BRFM 1775]